MAIKNEWFEMLEVVTCLVYEHNYSLVALAAAICGLSCIAAVTLLRRATATAGLARGLWITICGAAGGFGVWATHFIAMLAYTAGGGFSYEPAGTLASLVIAIGATSAAAAFFNFLPGREGSLAAGIVFGLGVTSMHFAGMAAIDFNGIIEWNRGLVMTSILLSVLLAVPAFAAVPVERASARRGFALSALLLTSSIVSLHFTAMGAVTVVPGPETVATEAGLPPYVLAAIIATVSFSLLLCGLSAALFAIRAEHAVAAEQANFNLLVHGVKDYAICMLDAAGSIASWNAGAERMLGYGASEVLGSSTAVFYPEDGTRTGGAVADLEAAVRNGHLDSESWMVRKDGSRFWAHIVIEPLMDDAGRHVGFAEIIKDGTEKKDAEARIVEASGNLNLALANMANAICLWGRDGRLVLHNEKIRDIFDVPTETDLVGLSFKEICDASLLANPDKGAEIAKFFEANQSLFETGGGELVTSISTGKSVRLIHSPTGSGSWVSTIEDITERVQSEEKISYLVRHDALTGLANRSEFEKILAREIESASQTGSRVAAICIDLDRFKEVNDTYGHATGDELLKVLASRMVEVCDNGEFIARFGGDEFAAIVPFSDNNELQAFGTRLLDALTGRTALAGTEVVTGASMGIAVYPTDATDPDKLLSNADMAMYRSKDSIDQKISFYESDMDEAARSRRSLVRDIWKALEEDQFHLAYQEQRDARTETLTGYEVLIRWDHPERGMVPPSDFIPAAEECGAISAIGDWVLRRACSDAANWRLEHKIAVNLSPLQLSNIGLAERVRAILEETGLPPRLLELEVTESAIIGDKERALEILRHIRELGVTIAIDDFGTGYSSLETLRSFPFDKIKLDRSFTSGLETSRQSKAFVRAIVALGKSLEVSILAEGVETREQMDVLVEEGCDQVQGFLFGRPGRLEQVSPKKAA